MTETTDAAGAEAARALYATDRASQGLGMTLVRAGAGSATVTMRVRADMTNGHGICHGGFIFALADSAFAFACNSHGPATVAAGVAIEFVAPARIDDELSATAREQWLGGRTGLYDITVTGREGTVLALVRGRSHRLGDKPVPSKS